jgi:exopolysaccharide biosynthesis predicted pyruvyltransferase EpsI
MEPAASASFNLLCRETELILPKHPCVLLANANTRNMHFMRQWLFSSNVEHTMQDLDDKQRQTRTSRSPAVE